jgi:hypothetical protein
MKKALAALAILVALAAGFAAGTFVDLRDDGPGKSDRALERERTDTTDGETRGSGDLTGPTGPCDHADTSGCAPGSELIITDDQWRCTQPLEEVAREVGGTLPLKVTAKFTTFIETSGPVVDLREGCEGDGTDAIDLILDIQGDGRTKGGINDAMSVKLDAHDIDITGNIDCGPRAEGSHQDGIQAQGARNIAFVDLEIGDWDDERATCTGAEAGIGISLGGVADIIPTGHKCIRCRVIACRRGINIGASLGTEIIDSRFRSGNPAEREERLATGLVGLCSFAVSTCEFQPTAREYSFDDSNDPSVCDEYPYEEADPAPAASSEP